MKIWGRRPILEAVRAQPGHIKKIFVARGSKGGTFDELLQLARTKRVSVAEVDRNELFRLVQHEDHQGVVASLSAPVSISADPVLLVREIKTRGEQPLLVLLDQVQDPQNFGAVLRSAVAAGAHGVVILKDRAVSVTPAVVKASAGVSIHIPICQVTNLVNTMEALKKEGVWMIGSDPSAVEAYTAMDWNRPVGLVMGQEGEGLRHLVKERCDVLVRIPLLGPVGSLNVSVATGILLFEILRSRSLVKKL